MTVICDSHQNMNFVNCSLSLLFKPVFRTKFNCVISIRNIPKILRFKSYLVLNDKLITIAAKISSFDTVWFVYVIDIKSVDHVSSKIDDCGQNVPKSHPYLLWSYLEQLNDNEKMCCISKKEKTKKVLCIHLLS